MEEGVFGKYRLERHIATGGMAQIWLATQQGPSGFEKRVVVKRVLPHFSQDPRFVTMFLDEARLAAQLVHANIAQTFELGEHEGTYFIAMEYVDGLNLAQMLTHAADLDPEGIPVEIAASTMAGVLQALDYAHNFRDGHGEHLGIVHRDVSPQNILVSVDGAVKLVDFGVARAARNEGKTEAGGVKGKLAYMAPEQIEQRTVDARADLFAAGIVFYELLTGVRPFGEDLTAVHKILMENPTDPRILRAAVDHELARIVMRALEKPLDARYQTAAEMLTDLEDYLAHARALIGPREIAAYAQALRTGVKPVTGRLRRTLQESAPGASTPDPGSAPAVVEAPHTGARPTAPPTAREVSRTASGQTPAFERSGSEATPSPPAASRLPAPLILALGGLLVAIVASGIGVAYLLIVPEESAMTSPTEALPAAATATPAIAVNNDALRHSDGGIVYVASVPEAEIHYLGKLVGRTPHQTNLRAGSYDVELVAQGQRKRVTLVVEPGRVVQRLTFTLP